MILAGKNVSNCFPLLWNSRCSCFVRNALRDARQAITGSSAVRSTPDRSNLSQNSVAAPFPSQCTICCQHVLSRAMEHPRTTIITSLPLTSTRICSIGWSATSPKSVYYGGTTTTTKAAICASGTCGTNGFSSSIYATPSRSICCPSTTTT